MGGFTTAVSVTQPREIWEYSDRKLTIRYGLIERVSPSYVGVPSVVYRAWRIMPSSARLILFSLSPNAQICRRSDDKVGSASVVSADSNLANEINIRDYNDNTYAHSTSTVNTLSELTLVVYDLGAVYSGYIHYYFYLYNFPGFMRVYVSADRVTWTKAYDNVASGNTRVVLLVSNTRYIRLALYNSSSTTTVTLSDSVWRGYTLEFYPLTSQKVLAGSDEETLVTALVDKGYYYLIEVLEV